VPANSYTQARLSVDAREVHHPVSNLHQSPASLTCIPASPPTPPSSTLFPYTTLFRSCARAKGDVSPGGAATCQGANGFRRVVQRSGEHTCVLQCACGCVCSRVVEQKAHRPTADAGRARVSIGTRQNKGAGSALDEPTR